MLRDLCVGTGARDGLEDLARDVATADVELPDGCSSGVRDRWVRRGEEGPAPGDESVSSSSGFRMRLGRKIRLLIKSSRCLASESIAPVGLADLRVFASGSSLI